jgi:TonB family protein
MIVIEFIVFVVSSGLFYSKNFRHRLWAVLIAGAVATGSSLLFAYDLAEKLMVHTEAPVKVVKQVVKVPVIKHYSQPPALSKPENCRDDYPFFARIFGDEGTTEVSFMVLADGTVKDPTVSKTSTYDRLDDAAVECVSRWHYRPGIKDGELVDTPMKVEVVWSLEGGADKAANKEKGEGNPK